MSDKLTELTSEYLSKVSDEDLETILKGLQDSTSNVFLEAWRRGIHKELAEKAMLWKDQNGGVYRV